MISCVQVKSAFNQPSAEQFGKGHNIYPKSLPQSPVFEKEIVGCLIIVQKK